MTKQLEYRDFAVPFTVPQGLSKQEVARYLADHHLAEARYYAQFQHTQRLAKWCETMALIDCLRITKN